MIKGIIFDKDGTLIEFYSMWMQAAMWVVPKLMKANKLDDTVQLHTCILEALGIVNGVLRPEGALAYKVYEDIAIDICNALQKKGVQVNANQLKVQMMELFQECLLKKQVALTPLCDLQQLMRNLKNKGYFIGMATADTMRSTKEFIHQFNLCAEFDYIGADDGRKLAKPDPHMFHEFQETCGLTSSEIAVVGDTYNDMLFGKNNGGISIGVLSGVCKEIDFSDKADYVLQSVNDLEVLLAQLEE